MTVCSRCHAICSAWPRSTENSRRSTRPGLACSKRPADFLLTHSFAQIIHPEDLSVTAATVTALHAGQPVHQFLVRLLKADGSAIPFCWSAVPDMTPGSNIFYTVGWDISDTVAAEVDLKLAQDALRQSQKMEAVGQLTGRHRPRFQQSPRRHRR